MADQGAKTAAGQGERIIWRFSAQVCTDDAATAAALSAAVTKQLNGSVLDSAIHVVKDDAHPAAKK